MSDDTNPIAADPEKAHVVSQWKHDSRLLSCRFDPLGRYVYTTAYDYTIQRWELATGTKTVLKAHDSWVRGLAFSPDGETLVSGGYDGRLIWWPVNGGDVTGESVAGEGVTEESATGEGVAGEGVAGEGVTGESVTEESATGEGVTEKKIEPQRIVEAHDGWIRWVDINSDGSLVATGGNDHLVKIWSFETGELVRSIAGHDRHIYSVHFHPSGESVFSGDLRGVVKQWSIADGSEIATYDAKALYTENPGQAAEYGGVRSMDFDASENRLVCSGLHEAPNPFAGEQQPLVVVFDGSTHEELHKFIAKEGLKCIAWRALFHPAGFILGACGGGGGGFLVFWRPDAETEFHRFKLPDTLRDMDLHPNGLLVATAHNDEHVRITRLSENQSAT